MTSETRLYLITLLKAAGQVVDESKTTGHLRREAVKLRLLTDTSATAESPTTTTTTTTTTVATGPQGPQGPQGQQGQQGTQGIQGPAGAAGQGVPTGGTANQILAKIDSTDYNTQWINNTGGSGGGGTEIDVGPLVITGSQSGEVVFGALVV